MGSRVLYLLASAAPPIFYLTDAVRAAQQAAWEICIGLTPTASDWITDEIPHLQELTGQIVRVTPRRPEEQSPWPPADVSIVAPATLNTVNACALGLTTNVVTGHVAEALGKHWPLVVMPCVNTAYATHPQFTRSVDTLRSAGVDVLLGEGGFIPNEPGQGQPETYPWHLAIQAAVRISPKAT